MTKFRTFLLASAMALVPVAAFAEPCQHVFEDEYVALHGNIATFDGEGDRQFTKIVLDDPICTSPDDLITEIAVAPLSIEWVGHHGEISG